ncbi:alpha/beta hydrolase family protein [Caulobacter sp. KR2-114]|uniref:alpha/beta hydrolase family protein n=1 Tax=Caulobacter sp. KR2-114 TaxID=3400912 RepID=UPI003C07D00F
MRKGWWLFILGWALILGGGAVARKIQTGGGVRVEDVRFPGAGGATLSALLYVPPNALARSPAPGVLAVHGYINSRETQDGFAIELARRGYVVLALDQAGHGYSSPPAFAGGFGGPAGLAYLRHLPMVDPTRIGLEGHSMGGWTVLAAAKAMPDAYRAMVLEGSSTGSGFAAEGDAAWPRNLAVVYSRYDEFSQLMWGVARARDVTTSAKLARVFGAPAPLVPGRLYGDLAAGTGRMLFTPTTTHPGDHVSPEAIGDALAWFDRTLGAPSPRDPADQVWMWKEAGTGVALFGFLALVLGAFDLLLGLPPFAGLRAAPSPQRTRRDLRWWAALALGAVIPVLTFYPFMGLGALAAPPSALFPQSITSQIMAWAVLNAAIIAVLGLLLRSPRTGVPARWLPSLGLALATAAIGYGALWLTDVLFKTDFRLWVVALKLMAPWQWTAFALYLAPFTLFFVVALSALHRNLAVAGEGAVATGATAIAAMAGGFLVFLAAEYLPLFLDGQLLTPDQPLNTVIAIQFLPLMAAVGLVSAFAWRRTGSALPGALVCALVVTWYMVAGTATHWAPGMAPPPAAKPAPAASSAPTAPAAR